MPLPLAHLRESTRRQLGGAPQVCALGRGMRASLLGPQRWARPSVASHALTVCARPAAGSPGLAYGSPPSGGRRGSGSPLGDGYSSSPPPSSSPQPPPPGIDLSWLPPTMCYNIKGTVPRGFEDQKNKPAISRKRRLATDAELSTGNFSPKKPWSANTITIDLSESSYRMNASIALDYGVTLNGKGVHASTDPRARTPILSLVPMGSSPALGDAHSPSRRERAEAARMAA
mgnify:CR=1 FL=1